MVETEKWATSSQKYDGDENRWMMKQQQPKKKAAKQEEAAAAGNGGRKEEEENKEKINRDDFQWRGAEEEEKETHQWSEIF